MKSVCVVMLAALLMGSGLPAEGMVFNGAMDNRAGFPYIPGFTAQTRALITGGDPGGGVRLEWQADNETVPGSWTYTYRLLRGSARNKGFGYFDIETAADFGAANILSRQVLSATDRSGLTIPQGLGVVSITGPFNFNASHDFSHAAVSEASSATVLNKFELSHYSGDPGRETPANQPGGPASATPQVGPVPHPFYGLRVTFPGSFADLLNLGYVTSAWEFSIVTDRVPMWGHVFGWGDQTALSPFWYTNFFNDRIDDDARLQLPPDNSLSGASPYQGWVLVPGPLPAVIATLPEDGVASVAAGEPVTATFGGLMDPASITGASFTLTAGGLPVAGAVSYDQSSKTATFMPAAPLASATLYTATITGGVHDLAGNALAAPKIWHFTVAAPDVTPPRVLTSLPNSATGNAGYVSPSASVSVSFSEAIDPATLDGQLTLSGPSGAVAGSISYDPATRTARFIPTTPLAYNTSYSASAAVGIADLAGNPLNAPASWTFTTIPQETVLPQVVSTVPAARAGNVPVTTHVQALFSEALDPATVNASSFTVAGVAGAVAFDQETATATFTPAVPLAFATTYTASVSTAVTDLVGNHLPLAREWTFTTLPQDLTPPQVSGVQPPANSRAVQPGATLSVTFTEAIDPASVTPASFTVTGQTYANSAPFAVPGTVSLSGGGLTLSSALFVPAVPLIRATTYTATIATGVRDLAGNALAAPVAWKFNTHPDGLLAPGSSPSIADALRLLRIAVHLIPPTADDLLHGDVAPLDGSGKPQPDGIIDVADALVLLRKVVGLLNF